jgi:hypothetical protein
MQPLEQRIVRAIECSNAPPITMETLSIMCVLQHIEAKTAEHAATGSKHESVACDIAIGELTTEITCAFAADDDACRFMADNSDHGMRLIMFVTNTTRGNPDIIKSYDGTPQNLHTQLKACDVVNLKLKFRALNLWNGEPHGWVKLEFGRMKGTPWVKAVTATVPTELLQKALKKLAQ